MQTQWQTIINLDGSRQANCIVQGDDIPPPVLAGGYTHIHAQIQIHAHTHTHTHTHTCMHNSETVYPDETVQSLLAYHSLTRMNNVAAAASAEEKASWDKLGCSRVSQM